MSNTLSFLVTRKESHIPENVYETIRLYSDVKKLIIYLKKNNV